MKVVIDVLTWITIVLMALFAINALFMSQETLASCTDKDELTARVLLSRFLGIGILSLFCLVGMLTEIFSLARFIG